MSNYYASVDSTNNTINNRLSLLNNLIADPVLGGYTATSVNTINNDYSIEIAFGNDIWTGSDTDRALLDKIINIIFNGDTPSTNPRRSVTSTNLVPSNIYDSTYNFSVGSKWTVSNLQRTYRCYDDTVSNASWISSLPFGVAGAISNSSVIQYNNTSGMWTPQPGSWNSISIAGSMMINDGITGPNISNIIGSLKTYTFSHNATQELYFTLNVPHDYAEGTDIVPIITYFSTTTNQGIVVWAIDYVWVNINAALTTPTTIAGVGSVATIYKNITSEFNTLSGSGKTISSSIICRLYRDGTNSADTYPDNVGLISCSFKYQLSGIGSSQMTSK